MQYELNLINAALTNQNIIEVFSSIDVNSIGTASIKKILMFIKEHQDKYNTIPTPNVVEDKFPEYRYSPTNEPLNFYIDQYKEFSAKTALTSVIENTAYQIKANKTFKALEYLRGGVQEIYKLYDITKEETLQETLGKLMETYIYQSHKVKRGIKTGFDKIDKNAMPLMPAELNIIFARSGVGKSWVALYMARNAWREAYNVLFISLELSKIDMVARLLAIDQGINKNLLKQGALPDDQQQKIIKFLEEIQGIKTKFIMEHRSTCNVFDIEALIQKHNPDVVFVDYLGLMDGHKNYFKSSNELKERMRDISKELKHLAVKHDIPIVAVHQSNRDFDDEKGKLPSLKNLADSDDIGRNADKVYAVHQTSALKESREIIIGTAKVRDAKDAQIICNWDLDSGDLGTNDRYYEDTSIESRKQEPKEDDAKIPF